MKRARIASIVIATSGLALTTALAGPLDPPAGPVAPTGKTLTEVEPRTAVNAANTPGDSGSMFIISQPGSYYLTGNIVGAGGYAGILINCSNVTLDLNGFELRGGGGASFGIETVSSNDVVIRNGLVDGWTQAGVYVAGGGGNIVSGIVARANGTGIYATARGAVITDCAATGNTAAGFDSGATTGTVYRDCASWQNTGVGFSVGNGSVVSGCSSTINAGGGFVSADNSQFDNCIALGNTGIGFQFYWGCTASKCSSIANTTWGFSASRYSKISGCHTRTNGNAAAGGGIDLVDTYASAIDNTCENDARGIRADGTNNLVIRNTVAGATVVTYSLVAGNRVGVIVTPTTAAAVNGSSGGGLGTTDPSANLAY
jgi:hypothetical protein